MRTEEQSLFAWPTRGETATLILIGVAGKDEQDWSDLVVPAPPLYIQEGFTEVLIDDLRRRSEANTKAAEEERPIC